MRTELRQSLEQVARRVRRVRLWAALAACWSAWAILALGLSAVLARAGSGPLPEGLILIAFGAGVLLSGAACGAWAFGSVRDRRAVARRIEARHPELGTGLLAAVEQEDATGPAGLGFLQAAVVRAALTHRRYHDWREAVPTRTMRGAQLAHAVALALLITACTTLLGHARSHTAGVGPIAPRSGVTEVQVDPGNAEVEKGAPLLVVARFEGDVPGDAALVVEGGKTPAARLAMTRSLEDPAFAGRIDSVDTDLAYRVTFEGRSTEPYRVHVFEYPELRRADARLAFPRYTALEPRTVEDVRHVTAVEGTELTLLCRLNKGVASARLVDEDGRAIALAASPDAPLTYKATLNLTAPRRYRVQLVDREGRRNKRPEEIAVNVTANRPAVVKLTRPGHDVRVSPLEELELRAEIEDDFGVVRHGLAYTVPGRPARELVLEGPRTPGRRVEAEHRLDFEGLGLAPDQLVTFYFWAEDLGPDGRPRRTSGDMFFAEVRPFEEIFRQGEAPPAGSADEEQAGGNTQEAGKLAELQKEIINGTWTLIRRHGAGAAGRIGDDAKVLADSQRAALGQADTLGGRLRDPASKASLAAAVRSMKDAEKHLDQAAGAALADPLGPALEAEQAAYQALLKLRAREFQVVRGNPRSRSGQNSAGGPSSVQLGQLELSEDENRYETQRNARAPQASTRREQEARETRQVLNRLKELAQRQADLNDRLKELQAALEAARTPEARREAERQLKRLRDQQQQILRDTDELRERMEREENRDRMAEARRQIEEGREHVRRASESLDEGRVPRAVTEGARAGQQLGEVRDQLRKGASDRFAEEMAELRGRARRLEQEQKRISEQIGSTERKGPRALRDGGGERTQARRALDAQRTQLDQTLDRMRQTVQDAEETEPILAKSLYEATRKADRQAIPEALEEAGKLVDAGIAEEAAKSSRRAAQGLEQLREGIERAAEGVLGDETAALKRAQGELEDLADQVNREIARATGRDPAGDAGDGTPPPDRDGRRGSDRPAPRPQAGGASGQEKAKGQARGSGSQGREAQPGRTAEGRQASGGRSAGGENRETPEAGRPQGRRLRSEPPRREGQAAASSKGEGREPGQPGPAGGGGAGARAGVRQMSEGLAGVGPGGPITGEDFRPWSDRMRDVEELLDDPEMRSEAARIRDRARGAREEFKRHAKEPDWDRLRDLVADPIRQLRERVAEEVRRRESPDSLVPIDRDPVPPQFAEGVRRYYERLGSGR